MESRDDQRRGAGNPAPATTYIILSRSGAGYLGSYAYPLIRMRFRGKEAIVCPLPTLLFWRITGGLYYELLSDPRFAQAFGDSFQEFVGLVIERACPEKGLRLIAEQRYGTKKAPKASVDWIVSDDGSAMFVECKARRLSWNSKATSLDDLRPLGADIDNMANAVVQVYKTIDDYMNGRYPHLPLAAERKIYPVIVTLENWHIFGHLFLKTLYEKMDAAEMPRDVLNNMPYSVLPIDDLEVGMQIISKVGIRIFMDGKMNNTEMRDWEWHPYMTHSFPKYFPARKLFAEEYEKIFARLAG